MRPSRPRCSRTRSRRRADALARVEQRRQPAGGRPRRGSARLCPRERLRRRPESRRRRRRRRPHHLLATWRPMGPCPVRGLAPWSAPRPCPIGFTRSGVAATGGLHRCFGGNPRGGLPMVRRLLDGEEPWAYENRGSVLEWAQDHVVLAVGCGRHHLVRRDLRDDAGRRTLVVVISRSAAYTRMCASTRTTRSARRAARIAVGAMGSLRPHAREEHDVNPPFQTAAQAPEAQQNAAQAVDPPQSRVVAMTEDQGVDDGPSSGRPAAVHVPYARTGAEPDVVSAPPIRGLRRPGRSPFWAAIHSHLGSW